MANGHKFNIEVMFLCFLLRWVLDIVLISIVINENLFFILQFHRHIQLNDLAQRADLVIENLLKLLARLRLDNDVETYIYTMKEVKVSSTLSPTVTFTRVYLANARFSCDCWYTK